MFVRFLCVCPFPGCFQFVCPFLCVSTVFSACLSLSCVFPGVCPFPVCFVRVCPFLSAPIWEPQAQVGGGPGFVDP